MELQHFNVKFFVEGELPVEAGRFIDVFHRWVKEETMDELLIDVADYRHVPAGPSVMVVGHEADYVLDNTGHRFGLKYNRKAHVEGDNDARLRQALCSAARACRMLEEEFAAEGLRFSRQELELTINDRALAPNEPATYEAAEPEIKACLADVLGHGELSFQREPEARRVFGLTIAAAQPFDFEAIEKEAMSTER